MQIVLDMDCKWIGWNDTVGKSVGEQHFEIIIERQNDICFVGCFYNKHFGIVVEYTFNKNLWFRNNDVKWRFLSSPSKIILKVSF
jgi:hypothetical protein